MRRQRPRVGGSADASRTQPTFPVEAGAPNGSYFQNWTGLEDRITWDVAAATAGRYEAVIDYACPPADAGEVR